MLYNAMQYNTISRASLSSTHITYSMMMSSRQARDFKDLDLDSILIHLYRLSAALSFLSLSFSPPPSLMLTIDYHLETNLTLTTRQNRILEMFHESPSK